MQKDHSEPRNNSFSHPNQFKNKPKRTSSTHTPQRPPFYVSAPQQIATLFPTNIIACTDKIRIWANRLLSSTELDFIAIECGRRPEPITPNKAKIQNKEHIWFFQRYGRFYDLHKPTPQAIQWLIDQQDQDPTNNEFYFNYDEEAVDLIFANENISDLAYRLLDQTLVKLYHRPEHVITHVKRTRYTSSRWTKNKLVLYDDKPSRITQEPYCVHIEYRVQGKKALRQNGIPELTDILNLDRYTFWKERLLLFTFDPSLLGQRYMNYLAATKTPRGVRATSIGRDRDYLEGRTLITGRRTQTILDKFKNLIDTRTCRIRIDNKHLLPAKGLNTIPNQLIY